MHKYGINTILLYVRIRPITPHSPSERSESGGMLCYMFSKVCSKRVDLNSLPIQLLVLQDYDVFGMEFAP